MIDQIVIKDYDEFLKLFGQPSKKNEFAEQAAIAHLQSTESQPDEDI
jgi:hypothetical protein